METLKNAIDVFWQQNAPDLDSDQVHQMEGERLARRYSFDAKMGPTVWEWLQSLSRWIPLGASDLPKQAGILEVGVLVTPIGIPNSNGMHTPYPVQLIESEDLYSTGLELTSTYNNERTRYVSYAVILDGEHRKKFFTALRDGLEQELSRPAGAGFVPFEQ